MKIKSWSTLSGNLTENDWTVLTMPAKEHRRAVLTRYAELGFDFCIRFPDRYEFLKEEGHMESRAAAYTAQTGDEPPRGKLRVGNGDNLHWLI